jgi:hypothetical protein
LVVSTRPENLTEKLPDAVGIATTAVDPVDVGASDLVEVTANRRQCLVNGQPLECWPAADTDTIGKGSNGQTGIGAANRLSVE